MNHHSSTTPIQRSGSRSTSTRRDLRSALSPTAQSTSEIPELWRMSRSARVTAMWDGQLTLAQLCAWSSRRPSEVPLLDGEFAWIIMRTPAWAEPDPPAPKAAP